MVRHFSGGALVIASHNPGKVREIAELLTPFGADVVSAADLGLSEPVEDGDTFIANAKIKAIAAATASGYPALADDSGLCVAALEDRPGIHSARWAGPDKDFALAMRTIEDKLAKLAAPTGHVDRSAHFVCALVLAWPDGHMETFEGRVDGNLVWPPRGDKGFGYDPVFQGVGASITFAEMAPEAKHAISHRADAFKKLVAACFGG